ncbi:MAG: cysteine dioxygenase family protein [Phycisphaerales bacterium]|nr:cysteine dioxygenase family protein [Phycisphaerales bacterium]
MKLREFFSELDQHHTRVPLDELMRQLRKLELHPDDVREFMHFNPERYQRNLVHEGPGYQALLLCWRNGQRSPIHNHRGSSCGVRVVVGNAVETFFERNEAGFIFANGSRTLREGEICGSQDDDMHQISNIQPAGRDLVTLHIYSPALLHMQVFSLDDNSIREFHDPIALLLDGAGI